MRGSLCASDVCLRDGDVSFSIGRSSFILYPVVVPVSQPSSSPPLSLPYLLALLPEPPSSLHLLCLVQDGTAQNVVEMSFKLLAGL